MKKDKFDEFMMKFTFWTWIVIGILLMVVLTINSTRGFG